MSGQTTAKENSMWSVGYEIEVDTGWRAKAVRAHNVTCAGRKELRLERSRSGGTVNGRHRPELSDCKDVDFESSAVTNTVPIHRIEFVVGVPVDVPAVFVRAEDLRVERLEQQYTLTEVTGEGLAFHYSSSTFEFNCELQFDAAGLIVDYPGIAARDS